MWGFLAALGATFSERVAWFEEHPADDPGVPPVEDVVSPWVQASTSPPAVTRLYDLPERSTRDTND